MLYQQAERRRQLRDELTALVAPAEFATMKADVLAVMDSAIPATEDASRGISEYQSDTYYSYGSYDQTPGWVSSRKHRSRSARTTVGRSPPTTPRSERSSRASPSASPCRSRQPKRNASPALQRNDRAASRRSP